MPHGSATRVEAIIKLATTAIAAKRLASIQQLGILLIAECVIILISHGLFVLLKSLGWKNGIGFPPFEPVFVFYRLLTGQRPMPPTIAASDVKPIAKQKIKGNKA